jgi:hypothetical protein
MTSQSTNGSTRVVLEGVPRVHFYEGGARCPEDLVFPSVLRAMLEYMGDKDFGCRHCMGCPPGSKITCTYSYVAGTSGVGSHLSWGPNWQHDNIAIHYMSNDPDAPYRRGFEAVGYPFEWLGREQGETAMRDRIVECIRDKGRPVIAFGVIGPPEPSIITGYDEGGDFLIGWSFFQGMPEFNAGVEFEPSGHFRKRDWFNATDCLAILGDKQARPDFGKTCREALRWAVELTHTSLAYGDRPSGLAAYEAWANDVIRDSEFPADDEAVLQAHHSVHNDAVGTVAEARWYGSQFLIEAVDHLPWQMTEDVLHAAACYAAEHALMWQAWDLLGGISNPEAYKKMVAPATRRELAQVILQSRDKYAQAADYMERALAKG